MLLTRSSDCSLEDENIPEPEPERTFFLRRCLSSSFACTHTDTKNTNEVWSRERVVFSRQSTMFACV